MKKLTLMLTVALMAIATTASAQFANSSKKSSGAVADTENYNRVSVGYSPINIEKISLTGLSAGWTRGFNLMQGQPLFLETGVNVMYGFGKDDIPGYEGYEVDYTYLAVNVPVLATWKFALSDQFTLAPYAGVNMRGNLILKAEADGEKLDFFDKPEDGGADAKRFTLGASFGVNVEYNKFALGVGYTTDFTELAKETKVDYLTISVGLKF